MAGAHAIADWPVPLGRPTGLAPNGATLTRAAGPTFGRAAPKVAFTADSVRVRWSPDLGRTPGSAAWWRDATILLALIAATWLLSPDLGPLRGDVPARLSGSAWDEARAQGISPLAFGSSTGRVKASNDLVAPIAAAPERPTLDEIVTVGAGDTLAAALTRAGVGVDDASAVAALMSRAAPTGGLVPGTSVALTLGARSARWQARPLDRLSLRARFDLAVTVERRAGRLALDARPIAIDTTPVRIAGVAGPSLYRAARAAGANAPEAEALIRALASRFSFAGDVAPTDAFAMVVERQRAATGDTRLGRLLLAQLDQPGRRSELVRWTAGGQEGWFDADGRFEQRGAVGMPVAGHITSGFGMRFHPLLGFSRMHKGIDIGAPVGTPVYAVVAGTVLSAGSSGGYGNFIRLAHGPGFSTGYGHLSRIAVASGQQVARGEVIGFVGSTGLSTGPHLHWEVWRNGVAIDPMTLSVDSVATLDAVQMATFRAQVARLRAIRG